MLNFLKDLIASFQEFVFVAGRAFQNIFRRPHYYDDVLIQMDIIGVGSLTIVMLTGFFSGAIIALQMSRALNTYGAASQVGAIVSITLVRELGPVLNGIAGGGPKCASGIASELGSMKVTEQIDAMRALGTDPVQKLVTPRLIATGVMLPLPDRDCGCYGPVREPIWCRCPSLGLLTGSEYWSSSWQVLVYNDLAQGLIKPFSLASSLPWWAASTECALRAAPRAWAMRQRKPLSPLDLDLLRSLADRQDIRQFMRIPDAGRP